MNKFVARPHPDRRELEIAGRYSLDADRPGEVLTVTSKNFAELITAMFETDHEATIDAVTAAVIGRAHPNRKQTEGAKPKARRDGSMGRVFDSRLAGGPGDGRSVQTDVAPGTVNSAGKVG